MTALNASSQLTEKQIKYREWYQLNKAKVSAQKRAGYQPKARQIKAKRANANKLRDTSDTSKSVFNRYSGEAKDVYPTNQVELIEITPSEDNNPNRLNVRRNIEDILLARELGLTIEDLV